MRRWFSVAAQAGVILAVSSGIGLGSAQAETVMQQCGQQYQTAKAANTLNGMSWNQFRSDCAAKLKAQPASATTAAPAAPAPAAVPAPAPAPTTKAANPLNPTATAAPAPKAAPVSTTAPAPTTASTTPTASPGATTNGRTAFVAREKECGAEWRANKVTLIAQTPGITWPKYLSQCNARLKAAGK